MLNYVFHALDKFALCRYPDTQITDANDISRTHLNEGILYVITASTDQKLTHDTSNILRIFQYALTKEML